VTPPWVRGPRGGFADPRQWVTLRPNAGHDITHAGSLPDPWQWVTE
jgi:hypothetical protein